jgi:nucleolar protein 15
MEELSSIMYIGHLPSEFEEKEMKKFFAQFGVVKNIQLSRSKKTGVSRHYGWIEFETPEIAKIAAKAMNKYLLFENLLVAEVLPTAKVHPMLFKNARRGPKKPKIYNPLTKKERALKLARQEKMIMATLAAKGIEYSWPSLVDQFLKLGVTISESIPSAEPAEDVEKKMEMEAVPK